MSFFFYFGRLCYAVLSVNPLYSIPFIEDFESSNVKWRLEKRLSDDKLFWQLGRGYRHHIEDAHSGVNAWHTSKSIEQKENDPKCLGACYTQYLLSPYVNLNLNATKAKVLNFWYKISGDCDAVVEYKSNCQKDWILLRNLSINRNDDWDYMNILVSSLANSTNVQFRISYNSSSTPVEGLIIDDFYVGDAKADLTVEGNKKDLFTSSNDNIEALRCLVVNSGLTKTKRSLMKFYWSDNEVFDNGDVFLGQKELPEISDTSSAWVEFIYTKPSNNEGTYYIFYQIDTDNAIDEMREYNNNGYFIINQIKPTPIPYYNDFEDQIIGWRHNASLGQDDWQWTTPKGRVLQSAFSGVKGWITKDTGLVSPMSRMHLYTPVFDLSTAKKPVIEFDMKLDSHGAQYAFEGKMNMSYSVDGGTNWIVLDTTSQSYNRWYYPMAFIDGLDKNYFTYIHTELLSDRREKAFVPFDTYNGRDVVREHRYNLDISFLAGVSSVQFRFNLATLTNTKNSINKAVEGAFIDNFSIQESTIDLNVDYKKALMISSKSDRIKFYMNIKNKGNFISNKTNVRFYVSRDTVLSSGDPLLGLESIPEIQPDKYQYLNVEFGVPINFSTYKYLLYELDKQNANIEENESNNIGYWPLALDSIKTYPYFNNFNDSIINGWHQYSVSEWERFKRNLRFRHILAPSESIYQRRIKSGEWFTEPYELHSSNAAPYFFLESPAFDFTKVDSIFLSFKLLCTGSREDGGNMQYSLNGGSTWQVLNKTTGLSHNWYNSWLPLLYLDNEPGWNFDAPLPSDTEILDSTSCGVTFLKGKKDVVFRFKHKSSLIMHGSGTVQGMRVDDFKVAAFGVDLIANNQFTPISAKLSNPFIDSYYSFSCKGNTTGRPSVTKVYWSKDSILESSDKLLAVFNEDALAPGKTARFPLFMTLPTPVTQLVYYLLSHLSKIK
jgi:hypothetical protein